MSFRESAFGLIKHIVEAHRQYTQAFKAGHYNQELAFARGAKKLIKYDKLDEESRKQVDYFDRCLKE